MDRRRVLTAFNVYVSNPIARWLLGIGVGRSSVALLETIGRKSGKVRHTPLGNGLKGDAFWIISEHGRRSGYVRNIEANPSVRVKVEGRWRTGTAHLMPGDDPIARQRMIGRKLNAAFVRLVGTDLLTVRIDLDPS